jgi:peptidoglycan/xylan/chitin deacetylase (PgdA/CDA1 family)
LSSRIGGAVKAAASAASSTRRPGGVILIFHRVGGRSGLEIDLDPGRFEEQITHIGDTAGSLTDVVEGRPVVVVTFDDGTADFTGHVLPILTRHNVPATLYLATAFIEEQRPFPHDGHPLSWDALRDCLSTGLVTVGSHTHSHVLLDRLAPNEIANELDRSIGLIEDRLGVTPEHFAYPKALLGSAEAQAAVRARFATAAIAGTRPNVAGRIDPHRLYRSPIQRSDGMKYFRRKLEGGMRLEDDLRRTLNRVRYLGKTQ